MQFLGKMNFIELANKQSQKIDAPLHFQRGGSKWQNTSFFYFFINESEHLLT